MGRALVNLQKGCDDKTIRGLKEKLNIMIIKNDKNLKHTVMVEMVLLTKASPTVDAQFKRTGVCLSAGVTYLTFVN